MMSISDSNLFHFIEPFNSTSRYLDEFLLNIDNPYFEQMVSQISPLQLGNFLLHSSPLFRLVHNEWHSFI